MQCNQCHAIRHREIASDVPPCLLHCVARGGRLAYGLCFKPPAKRQSICRPTLHEKSSRLHATRDGERSARGGVWSKDERVDVTNRYRIAYLEWSQSASPSPHTLSDCFDPVCRLTQSSVSQKPNERKRTLGGKHGRPECDSALLHRRRFLSWHKTTEAHTPSRVVGASVACSAL